MAKNVIENGMHTLTGVGEVAWKNELGESVNGIVLQIDGKNYVAFTDPEDGYRSYGMFCESEHKPSATFAGEQVFARNNEENGTDDGGYSITKRMLRLYTLSGDLLLEVGTDFTDSYYPMAIFHWNPEFLTANKGR